jgi:hypothetical protein
VKIMTYHPKVPVIRRTASASGGTVHLIRGVHGRHAEAAMCGTVSPRGWHFVRGSLTPTDCATCMLAYERACGQGDWLDEQEITGKGYDDNLPLGKDRSSTR